MTEFTDRQELNDRLSLIENMIAEGRQTTESWGWTFVLWGVAYYVAIAWSSQGYAAIAWPVTMIATGIFTGIVASRKADHSPATTLGRSITAIWIALGMSLLVFGTAAGFAHQHGQRDAIATVAVLLGMANATSSLILRWKPQFACAIVWWATAVVSLLGTLIQSRVAFLAATFLCQIVFGSYMMISESRRSGQRQTVKAGAHHA